VKLRSTRQPRTFESICDRQSLPFRDPTIARFIVAREAENALEMRPAAIRHSAFPKINGTS
jgi:hypothetical protein